MRTLAALSVLLCLGLPALPVTQKKVTRPATGKSTTSASSHSKKTSGRTAGRTATVARKTTAKKRPARRTARSRPKRQSWRTGQMTPTPERYREIQQALIDKGYLAGAASGVWGPDCTQALKKFQQDQNLQPDGKLDSLTLISLGLGPRREPLGSTAVIKSPPGAEPGEPQ